MNILTLDNSSLIFGVNILLTFIKLCILLVSHQPFDAENVFAIFYISDILYLLNIYNYKYIINILYISYLDFNRIDLKLSIRQSYNYSHVQILHQRDWRVMVRLSSQWSSSLPCLQISNFWLKPYENNLTHSYPVIYFVSCCPIPLKEEGQAALG